jgi:hypothetical protein
MPTQMADFSAADGSAQRVLDEDPSDRPTQMADYRAAAGADSTAGPDVVPRPWYKNRVMLGLWAAAAILVLVLIVYGIVEISRGTGSNSTPTTTSSTTSSTTSTSSSTSTPSTTNETSPPPETPEQTPEQAPPPQQGNNSSAPAPPTHHHHHFPHIPLPHF